MSVYVVTRDQRLLRYDGPQCGRNAWIRHDGYRWKVYYKSCTCVKCEVLEHEVLIAYVDPTQIVSIGFERPVVVGGRLLSVEVKSQLRALGDWVERRGAPKKLLPALAALKPITATVQ